MVPEKSLGLQGADAGGQPEHTNLAESEAEAGLPPSRKNTHRSQLPLEIGGKLLSLLPPPYLK